MGISRIILVVFTYVFFQDVASKSCRQSNVPNFKTEPSTRTVRAGDDVLLECAVANFDDSSDELTWQIRPDQHRSEVNEHYVSKRSEYISVIKILDVGRQNVHVSCKVTYSARSDERASLQGSQVCHITSRATLYVEYFPFQHELSCIPGPGELHALHEGDVISVRCAVSRSQPAVDMNWYFRQSVGLILPLPTLTDEGRTRVLTSDLQIRREHHLKSIACVVTSAVAFPGKEIACSIGPIKVLQAPRIQPRPAEMNITTVGSIVLACQAIGFPDITYRWSCWPEATLYSSNWTNQTITLAILDGVTFDTNYVLVTCTATNSEGSDSSYTRVVLLQPALKEEVSNEPDEVSGEIEIALDFDGSVLEVFCYFHPNDTQCMANFTWFVDGGPVTDEDDFVIRRLSHSSTSIRTYYPIASAKYRVMCRATVCQSVVYTSRTVTLSKANSAFVDRYFDIAEWDDRSTQTALTSNEISSSFQKTITRAISSNPPKNTKEKWDDAQTSDRLSMSKMIIIIITAIISFTILTAFGVIVVGYFLKKVVFRPSWSGPSTAPIEQSQGIPLPSFNISSIVQSLYQIPDSMTEQGICPISTPCPSIDHTYNTQVFTTSSSGGSHSSSSVTVSSEESCSSRDESFEHEYESYNYEIPARAAYVNQSLIDIRLKHRESFSVSKKGEWIMEKCLNITVPEIPKSAIPHEHKRSYSV